MARAIWSGTISFALINIPIKLYTARSPKEIHFNQLHEKDGSRIQMKRFCALEQKEIPFDEVVKGYEVSKDQYIVFSKEELETIEAEANRAIEIQDFVDLDQIDPIYYENTYYVMPAEGAARAYNLLRTAMQQANKVVIARAVMRTKEYIVAIRPFHEALCMSTMLHADEVVPIESLGLLPANTLPANPRELTMANMLIESLVADFEPKKYHDEYRERLLALIEQKAQGHAIAAPAPEARPAKVVDLMAALEASLAASQKKAAPARAPARKRKSA